MSQQITIKFDSKLKKPEIKIPITDTTPNEVGKENFDKNISDKQQTSVYGIRTPLIMINNIVIDWSDVNSFTLKSEGPLPTLDIDVNDRHNFIESIDSPGLDNTVVVQILPPFDNAYKKINLIFYISNMSITGKRVRLSGSYKVPSLLKDNIKSFGIIDTYKMFEQIATETQLGFSSNCESTNGDERYIYCDNISYIEMMGREIRRAKSDKTHIYNYWVDVWDALNLVDIYKRYNDVDKGEDLMIWMSGQRNETKLDTPVAPIQTKAVLSNHPSMNNTDLFVIKKDIINHSGGNIGSGTDKVYSIYNDNQMEYIDTLIQDGDVKDDILTKLYYLGEVYGDYDYLLPEACYSSYMQKLNTETMKVTIAGPNLGLMRGKKVEFKWYINDDNWAMRTKGLEDSGAINKYDDIKIPNMDNDKESQDAEKVLDGSWKLDKSVSGQYTIIGHSFNYSMGQWRYVLTLVRPHTDKPEIVKKEDKK